MTFIFTILIASSFYFATAQNVSAGSTIVTTTQCNSNNSCTCTVSPPKPCDADIGYRELQAVTADLAKVKAQVSGELLDNVQSTVNGLVVRLSTLEESLHHQSVSLTMSELSRLQVDVSQIIVTIDGMSADRNNTVLTQLQAEVELIHSTLMSLKAKNPISVREDMEVEMDRMRARLEDCKVQTNAHQESGLDFLGDALAFNKTISNQHCPASPLNLTIGKPVTFKFRDGVAGVWMKDPMPVSEEAKNRVYEIRTHGATNQYLYYWDNVDDYESALFESKKKTERCPIHTYGTKPLYLNGNLYWIDNSYKANKMDLKSSSCNAVKTAFSHPTNYRYAGNPTTYGDLNFDETGLYDVYANSEGDLMIARVNPVTLVVEHIWNTGKQKSSIALVFMVCGRLYTTDDFKSRHLTGLQWGFDTITGKEFLHEFAIESEFSNVQQLSYNPREKAIFGWDNQHAVLYPVFY